MSPSEPLRLCATCSPQHYENCPECYGFGVRGKPRADGTSQPISTNRAHRIRHGNARKYMREYGWLACPTCGSTPHGAPA